MNDRCDVQAVDSYLQVDTVSQPWATRGRSEGAMMITPLTSISKKSMSCMS
jgi:hypothetical protein